MHPGCPSPKTICIRGASLPGKFLESTRAPKTPPCWPTCKSRHSRGHKDIVACPHFPSLNTISIPGASLKTVSDSTKAPETPSDRPTCKCLRHKDIAPTLPSPQGELYPPAVSPLVIGGLPTLPEPQDEAYSPSVSPRVIFGQHHGTGNTPANNWGPHAATSRV